MLKSVNPLVNTLRIRVPITAPQIVPIPPEWLVPPIVVAAITVSSYPEAAPGWMLATRPANKIDARAAVIPA